MDILNKIFDEDKYTLLIYYCTLSVYCLPVKYNIQTFN